MTHKPECHIDQALAAIDDVLAGHETQHSPEMAMRVQEADQCWRCLARWAETDVGLCHACSDELAGEAPPAPKSGIADIAKRARSYLLVVNADAISISWVGYARTEGPEPVLVVRDELHIHEGQELTGIFVEAALDNDEPANRAERRARPGRNARDGRDQAIRNGRRTFGQRDPITRSARRDHFGRRR